MDGLYLTVLYTLLQIKLSV